MQKQETNPLKSELKMTKQIWLRTIVFGIVLLPLRICLASSILFIIWIYAKFRLIRRGEGKPMTEAEMTVFGRLIRVWAGSGGIVYKLSGEISKEAKILVVAPHTSYFDVLLAGWLGTPSPMVARAFGTLPVFGTFAQKMIE